MKTTVNSGKRTALFWFLSATFLVSFMAHGAGAAKFGTLRNPDWVVTNAWIAASNRVDSFVSNNIISSISRFSETGTIYRSSSLGNDKRWIDSTGCVWQIVGDLTNLVDMLALKSDITDSISLEPATNYANTIARDATNYTDDVVSAFALTNQVLMAGPYLSATGGIVSGTVTVEGKALIDEIAPGHVTIGRDGVSLRIGTYPFTTTARASWPFGNGTIALDRDIIRATNALAQAATSYTDSATNALAAIVGGKVSATNESGTAHIGWDGEIFRFSYGIQVDASPIYLPPSLNGVYFGEQSLADILDERSLDATNYTDAATDGVLIAARSYTDDSISTNNQAFVSAVLAAPLAGASASDISEIAEYGGYGTVGAALLALIAGLAAIKRRMASAETAIAGKAAAADLPYALVTVAVENGTGTLSDRASNRVTPADATALTLTLPPATAGRARDLIVRLDLTNAATAPEVTFAAPAGETVTFETEDDAMPELEAGKVNLVSFTETASGVIDVAHKVMQEVA